MPKDLRAFFVYTQEHAYTQAHRHTYMETCLFMQWDAVFLKEQQETWKRKKKKTRGD